MRRRKARSAKRLLRIKVNANNSAEVAIDKFLDAVKSCRGVVIFVHRFRRHFFFFFHFESSP
jgi:hypothetical protein